ncbi:MAG: hypothetical protein H6679_04265 [Epsilonproteobacteria bacterium]|nr:hypothetical protein [Campylobacterota bacterium]
MQSNSPLGAIRSLWSIKEEFKLKVYFLSLTFLLMSACLVIWRPLKIAVFTKMIGAGYIPDAKIYSLLFIIPLIILYSKLVDWCRRHHLLYYFTLLHGAGGIVFAYLLSHPVIGIANTHASPDRYIGWAWYFFMESFDAFFATTFWSFASSVNNHKDAKNYFGFFVTGSKIGGLLTGGALYLIMLSTSIESQLILLPQVLLGGSFFLFGAAFSVYLLIKKVPDKYMHGYEAAYQLETTKQLEPKSFIRSLKSSIDGLLIIIKNPYVLGIFSLVVFYEVMVVIFDWRVTLYADAIHSTVGGMTGYYAFYYMILNVIGLAVSFLGTTPLLRVLGIRYSLFVFPLLCLCMMLVTFFFPTAWVFFWVLVGLRSFNYAINHPTREALYIPTTKDVKFKAKTWTDAFGSRIAKSCGSIFNVALKSTSPAFAVVASIGLSLGLTSLWLIIIYFLGRTLQDAIDNKKVIGQNQQPVQEAQAPAPAHIKKPVSV